MNLHNNLLIHLSFCGKDDANKPVALAHSGGYSVVASIIAIEELIKEVNDLQEKPVARQVISKYEQVESMGFGLKELKEQANTVKEIAEGNDVP